MSELIYLACLHSLGISQRKLLQIFENKDNYKEFYEKLNYQSLKPFLGEKEITSVLGKLEKINPDDIAKIIKEKRVEIVTFKDKSYPELLKQITNPPYLFYLRGIVDNSPKIVIIGSRSMTSYGKRAIEKLVPGLSKYFTIVSGGAFGCDSEAHLQTLKNNGKTIAVIGTGIDLDYPIQNKKLFDDIVTKGGGIISIFPVGEVANTYNFPIRNEIVSAISSGVVVIESGEKSGTLITANLALEQGKDVFAVPGDLYKSNSIGCNNLIKNGNAKMITVTEDILEEYNIKTKFDETSKQNIVFGNNIEKIIYDKLLLESLDTDDIVLKTGLGLGDTMTNISMLEIKGIIRKSVNGKYEIR